MADKKDEQDVPNIKQDIVVTKYKMAGDMVNAILKEVTAKCVDGAKVLDICSFGDQRLTEDTGKVFKKEKDMKKGIAFPTCVSVNNCVCHFSPLASDPDIFLKDGDVVKIDLGAHVDGFAAVVAHTLVVGASKENKVTGRKADVILAAHYAAEAALRLVKPGNENIAVSETVQKLVESYNCKPVEGMLSHQLAQFVIDGEKTILLTSNEATRKSHEKKEFLLHEVYGIDLLVSSGEGKGKEKDMRPTVYKRNEDVVYQLKMKASKQFLSDVDKKFGAFPFTLRSFEDEKKAKLGVVECTKHGLTDPFSVLWEKEGECVAQFKYTVLLMPNGPQRITQGPFDPDLFESECKIENEKLKELLSTSANPKAAKKKKKRAEKAIAENAAQPIES